MLPGLQDAQVEEGGEGMSDYEGYGTEESENRRIEMQEKRVESVKAEARKEIAALLAKNKELEKGRECSWCFNESDVPICSSCLKKVDAEITTLKAEKEKLETRFKKLLDTKGKLYDKGFDDGVKSNKKWERLEIAALKEKVKELLDCGLQELGAEKAIAAIRNGVDNLPIIKVERSTFGEVKANMNQERTIAIEKDKVLAILLDLSIKEKLKFK